MKQNPPFFKKYCFIRYQKLYTKELLILTHA